MELSAISTDNSTQEPIVTYSRSLEQEGENAIVAAFSKDPININPAEMEPLYEWVDVPVLDRLIESTRVNARISTVIWGHQVTITSDTVEIYELDRSA